MHRAHLSAPLGLKLDRFAVPETISVPRRADILAPRYSRWREAATHITVGGLRKAFGGDPVYVGFNIDLSEVGIVSDSEPNVCGESALTNKVLGLLAMSPKVEIRMHDFTADMPYDLLSLLPAGSAEWPVERLIGAVQPGTLIGTAIA